MIALIDVLNLMDEVDVSGKPNPFSIKFITCNRQKQTGGRIVHLPKAIKHVSGSGKVAKDPASGTAPSGKVVRNPNHARNSTRNLSVPGTNEIIKCHIRLITEFNGHKVVY